MNNQLRIILHWGYIANSRMKTIAYFYMHLEILIVLCAQFLNFDKMIRGTLKSMGFIISWEMYIVIKLTFKTTIIWSVAQLYSEKKSRVLLSNPSIYKRKKDLMLSNIDLLLMFASALTSAAMLTSLTCTLFSLMKTNPKLLDAQAISIMLEVLALSAVMFLVSIERVTVIIVLVVLFALFNTLLVTMMVFELKYKVMHSQGKYERQILSFLATPASWNVIFPVLALTLSLLIIVRILHRLIRDHNSSKYK